MSCIRFRIEFISRVDLHIILEYLNERYKTFNIGVDSASVPLNRWRHKFGYIIPYLEKHEHVADGTMQWIMDCCTGNPLTLEYLIVMRFHANLVNY